MFWNRLDQTIKVEAAAGGGCHRKNRRSGQNLAAARGAFGRCVWGLWTSFGGSEKMGRWVFSIRSQWCGW